MIRNKPWEDISLEEKSDIMKVAVHQGIRNLEDIKKSYNSFAEGGPKKSYQDFMRRLSDAWGGQDLSKDDYDYEKYYNDDPARAYAQLMSIEAGGKGHFPDEGISGTYKTPNHPTYPDLGEKSWSDNDTVFHMSERQAFGDTDRILHYLGNDLFYNNGGTKVMYEDAYQLPSITVTPKEVYSELVPNKYHTGFVYKDSPNRAYGYGGQMQSNLMNRGKQAVSYFMSKGLPREAAAGLVANLIEESKLNPTAVNQTSKAYGIAQWLGDRKKRLFSKYGMNPSFENQLEYVWHELNNSHKKGLKHIMSSTTPADSARNTLGYYEFSAGPQSAIKALGKDGKSSLQRRINNSQILYGQVPVTIENAGNDVNLETQPAPIKIEPSKVIPNLVPAGAPQSIVPNFSQSYVQSYMTPNPAMTNINNINAIFKQAGEEEPLMIGQQ